MSWKETDPLNLWKGSKLQGAEPVDFKARTSLSERYGGTRSQIWASLSQLPPNEQQKFLHTLVGHWPYKWEKRAFTWPMHATLMETAGTSIFAAWKIYADVYHNRPRMGFMEMIRTSPKSSLFFAGYTALLSCFGLSQTLVHTRLIAEEKPCESCVLTRNILIAITSGVIVPCCSLPYLAHFNAATLNPKLPVVQNYIHYMTLCYEGSRSMWKHFKWLLPLQVAVATSATYITLWGRSRIFDTMDADPEFVREAVSKADESTSWKEYAKNLLEQAPLINRMSDAVPEDTRPLDLSIYGSGKT